jgi:hypothetical protein
MQDFLREPSEEEWARVSVYAKRIHCFMDSGRAVLSEAALGLLNTHFSDRCMVPKVRDIRWLGAPPEHLELMLSLIVSPILANFRLGLYSSRSASVTPRSMILRSSAQLLISCSNVVPTKSAPSGWFLPYPRRPPSTPRSSRTWRCLSLGPTQRS